VTGVREGFPDGPLTILFSDVEGSTDLRTQRGDAVAHRLLRSHEDVVRSCLGPYDGREIKALGDGFMIAFASTRKALSCAVAIQQGLAQRNRAAPGEEVHVRIGINTGEVVVEGDDLYGQAVNAAARIAARARGGEILISEVVRALIGSGPDFSFTDRGRFRLKGFPERWRLFAVDYAAPDTAGLSVAFGGRTPFVGRDAERTELGRLMERAIAGQGGLVLLGGEPGVGKTRLTEELAAGTRDRCRTLVGHCYASGRDVPYMPWVEMLEVAVREADPASLQQTFGAEAPELARLVPELRGLVPGIPAPVDLPPEQQRRFTFNAVRDFVSRVCQVQPRLYVVEDLHWADESTLLLLEHLVERLPEIPCLVVGTYRDNSAEVSPQLAETLARLVRLRHVRSLGLTRHSVAEVETLLRALSGQAPPPEIGAAIFAETEGNAYFVEEVYRHFAESGLLLDEAGRFRSVVSIGELDVPANVRLVIGQRLERLSEGTQRVLGTAAVMGRQFDFELLESVTEVTGDGLIDALDAAERAGLIVTDPSGAREEYWFAHELTRQTILTRLPATRRRRHHLRVAGAMEAAYAENLPAHAATIAAHLVAAGSSADGAKLFELLVLAGKRSLSSAAFEDALRHLRRAAALAQLATPAGCADMYFQLGMAERSAGRYADAVAAWRRSVEIHTELGNAEAIGRACLAAAYGVAFTGRWAEAYEMSLQGLGALGHRRTGDRARLLAVAGICVAGAGDYDGGMVSIAQALTLAEELGDAATLGYALLWKTCVHLLYVEMHECVEAGRRGAEMLRAAGDLWHLSGVLGMFAQALGGVGDLAATRILAAELEPLAGRLGNYPALMQGRRAAGVAAYCESGDPDAMAAFARRDIELCEQAGIVWVCQGWLLLAQSEFLLGNWAEAIRLAEKAEALAPPGVMRGFEWSALLAFRAHAGQREQALAMLVERRDELPVPGLPTSWGQSDMVQAAVEALVVLGEPEQAAALYPTVRALLTRNRAVSGFFPDARLLERTAAMAAAAGGQWAAADGHFATARKLADELPHLPEQAHTRRFQAAMLLRRGAAGDEATARQLLDEAAELYRGMGMPRHLAMVEAMRGPRGASRPPEPRPGGS
jgi:class 3 adenylate cyclase/tetratricopeptide (TPR) repeat protein